MPVLSTLGAMSSRGFGQNASVQANYIEDYFSTYLYDGTGAAQTITNNIPLTTTAAWSTAKLQLGASRAYATTTDSSGNVYTTGHATDSGVTYCFIAKYSSSLSLQWKRKFSQNATVGRGIAVDSSGNVYVTGNASDGSNYIFVAKYDSSGTIQWQRKVRQNSSASTIGQAIAVSSAGNVYVVGTVFNIISGLQTFIVIKYNTSGTLQWQRAISDTSDNNGQSVALDSSENVYVTGRANDGTRNTIVVAKYNSSGTIQWNRKLYQGSSYGYGISVDSSSNVYVTGFATDTSAYIIVAKYNSSGAIQWQRKIKNLISSGWAISTDSAGNSYIAGTYNSAANMCVIKYDTSGSLQWQRNLTQTANNSYGISVYSNNVYVAGYGTDSANYAFTSVIPTDGTATAGTAFLTLTLGDGTDAAGTATDAAATATDSAGAATDSAGTATDAADSAISSIATQAATNGAGLVWMKSRSSATVNSLYDTVRGVQKQLVSNQYSGQTTDSTGLLSFNANGFSIGSSSTINTNGSTYVSWTFRPKSNFFQIVQYTGNGSTQTISHGLGSVPGMIIVKQQNGNGDWVVYHKNLPNNQYLDLQLNTGAQVSSTMWNNTAPTSSVFSVGNNINTNTNGELYIAYVFANDAGGFGINGSQSAIKCGAYTGNATDGNFVNLGWEPQFVIIKSYDGASSNWFIVDNMRGVTASATANVLYANLANAEVQVSAGASGISFGATGFSLSVGNLNTNNAQYVYMAIRRGPMKVPTDATTVFQPIAVTPSLGTISTTGFATDAMWLTYPAGTETRRMYDKLRGIGVQSPPPYEKLLRTNTIDAEIDSTPVTYNWWNTGYTWSGSYAGLSMISYAFLRAPSFFDVVCYTGTGSATTIAHNLGVVPELMITKRRNTTSDWGVYSASLGATKGLYLNTTAAAFSSVLMWNDTAPTSSVFTVRSAGETNASGSTYVAYLFASCPGVSKVGSYTGTGATQTISCGFTGGARYVLIKRTNSTGDWWVWDTARGMVAGTDPRLTYNSNATEANANWVYTTTGGFQIVTSDATVNANGGTYIYLAIA